MVRPGDRIAERYEVIEQLAAGGMGVLWRARHLELEVDVAIKLISAEAATPVSLKRFKREAQAAARLHSPNVVRVHDYGVFEGQPFLAMELLHGEDLAARLARSGKLPPDECLRVLSEVGRGLDLVHGAGVVHRDLKPANIFIERLEDREVIKLIDFGVAKDVTRAAEAATTTDAGVVGSPAYMSPEQVWGEAVGPATDLWAMSVVAFELLTGKSPFVDETLAKVFERIIRSPLPRARELVPELPVTIEAFFERGWSRAPEKRFSSARELVEALEAALRGESSTPAVAVARRKSRVWPVLALFLPLAAVVILAKWAAAPAPRPPVVTIASPPPPVEQPPLELPRPVASQVSSVAASAPAPLAVPRVVRAPAGARSAAPTPAANPALTDPQFGIPVPN